MELAEAMAQLESMGTEQNRKVYRRHGAQEPQFGVSFANLNKLKKQTKMDHTLAQQLWQTRNTDARVLATMIADPKQASEKLVETWLRGCRRYYMLVDVFVSNVVAKAPFARRKAEQWIESDDEWAARAGWSLLGRLALDDPTLPDSYFAPFIDRIARDIHLARNRAREAMNSALIAIGMRSTPLHKRAIAAAGRIGKVEVDHGETSCRTPDAAAYIRKAAARKQAKRKPVAAVGG